MLIADYETIKEIIRMEWMNNLLVQIECRNHLRESVYAVQWEKKANVKVFTQNANLFDTNCSFVNEQNLNICAISNI